MKRWVMPTLLSALCLIALLPRIHNLDRGLPQRFPADEASQVETAHGMLGGDLNPHFFRYPTAQMYLMSGLYAVGGLSSPVEDGPLRYLLARVVSSLMGVSTVLLLFLVVRQFIGTPGALLAALFLAVNPTHVELSHYATVDVPLVMWVVVMLTFLVYGAASTGREERKKGESEKRTIGSAQKITEGPRWGMLLAAGIAMGLALGTKYTSIFIYPLYVFGVWWALRERQENAGINRKLAGIVGMSLAVLIAIASVLVVTCRDDLLVMAAAYTTDGIVEAEYGYFFLRLFVVGLSMSLLLAALSVVFFRGSPHNGFHRFRDLRVLMLLALPALVFALVSPYVLIDWQHSLQDILYEYRHMAIGSAAHFEAGSEQFQTVIRETLNRSSLIYYEQFFLNTVGMAFLLMTCAGWIIAIRMKSWFMVVIGVVAGIYTIVILSWSNLADRYALPLIPLFIILAALGLSAVLSHLPRLRWVTWLLATVLLLFVPVRRSIEFLEEYHLPDTRAQALHWLQRAAPDGSNVALDDKSVDLKFVPSFGTVIKSTGSIIADLPEHALLDGSISFIVLRDSLNDNAVPAGNREAFRLRYLERAQFQPKHGSRTGPRLRIYEFM